MNNIRSYLKVLNECGDNVPRFISMSCHQWLLRTWIFAAFSGKWGSYTLKYQLQAETSEGPCSVLWVTVQEKSAKHCYTRHIVPMRCPDKANASTVNINAVVAVLMAQRWWLEELLREVNSVEESYMHCQCLYGAFMNYIKPVFVALMLLVNQL